MNTYRLFIFVLLLALVVSDDDNGTYIFDSPVDKIAGNPGFCYVKEIGLFNNREPVKQGKACSEVRCLDNGQYVQTMCPPLIEEIDYLCHLLYPSDVPFPKCCDHLQIECPPDNGDSK